MTNRAYNSGAAGTIVDGRIRDLQEHRDLKYPVCRTYKTLLFMGSPS